IRQRSGCNGHAAGNMCELWSHFAARIRSSNLMTRHARGVKKNVAAVPRLVTGRVDGRPALLLEPCFEFLRTFGDDQEAHLRVLVPAEFGTLSAIDARPVGLNR